MPGVVDRIVSFNRGREPVLLAQKYRLMRSDPFAFYRGTCHLFYEDWPADSILNQAPLAWACGDLHLENMGSYRGDNDLTYFDINDFDEGALAPCTWDLARLLTGILVGARSLNVDGELAQALCRRCADHYFATLAAGREDRIETATARGMVRDLLVSLKHRRQVAFLRERTERDGRLLRLHIDGIHTRKASKRERKAVKAVIDAWRMTQPDPDFYRVLDVAHHVAGLGSLGLDNYVLLVAGRDKRHDLLNLKAEPGSTLAPFLRVPQAAWPNHAARVVAIQRRMQAVPPARLSAVPASNGNSFLLRELQPTQDRIQLDGWQGKLARLEHLIDTVGRLLGWAQLRSSGRQGSANADELMTFAAAPEWCSAALANAEHYHALVMADHAEFCAAYDRGALRDA